MKKLFVLLLCFAVVSLTMCGCRNNVDNKIEQMKKASSIAAEAADQAEAKYDYLVDALDRIDDMNDALGID